MGDSVALPARIRDDRHAPQDLRATEFRGIATHRGRAPACKCLSPAPGERQGDGASTRRRRCVLGAAPRDGVRRARRVIAVDTNLLVQAHREDSVCHEAAYARIRGAQGRVPALDERAHADHRRSIRSTPGSNRRVSRSSPKVKAIGCSLSRCCGRDESWGRSCTMRALRLCAWSTMSGNCGPPIATSGGSQASGSAIP
jgi:hypothetical protein